MHAPRRNGSLAIAFALLAARCGHGDGFVLDSGPDAHDAADRASPVDIPVPSDDPVDVPFVLLDAGTDAPVATDTADVGPAMDARDASDAGAMTDVPGDIAPDGIVLDAPTPDVPSGAPGRCTPVIDGAIGADWTTDAVVGRNTTATAWPGNELHVLHVCYDAAHLYLGLEGTVQAANAIVVYIDRDFHGGSGGSATGIALFTALTDHSGNLDAHVSAALTLGPLANGFGAEGAWGTVGMRSLADTAVDDAVGLRLFWPAGGTAPDGGTLPDRRGDFAWQAGAYDECRDSGTTSVCEVSIAWTSLFDGPAPAHTTLALFARIQSADGSMSSNQTLPMDDPSNPRAVDHLLVLPVVP